MEVTPPSPRNLTNAERARVIEWCESIEFAMHQPETVERDWVVKMIDLLKGILTP